MTITLALSPECRLVHRSADPAIRGGECAALASHVRDWERVLVLAERDLATAVLARALKADSATLPEAAWESLRRRAMMAELRMQYLSHRLQQTTALLSERGIPFLLLKGAAVGAMRDPTFRWRPMNDADILVRPADVPRAREAVIDSGWPVTTDPALLELLADHHHLPHFVDPQMEGIRIELHVALLPAGHPFAFDEEQIWRDARPAAGPFAGAHIPSPEHLLLHAAIHFAWQHRVTFGAWRTFRALAAATGAADFEWDRLTAQALAARAGTVCYWTLRLSERLAGLPVPAEVLRHLAPPTPAWAGNALERHFIALIAAGETPASPSVQLSDWLWTAAMRPRWSGHPRPPRALNGKARTANAVRTAHAPGVGERLVRHLSGYRRWTEFIMRTLLGSRA